MQQHKYPDEQLNHQNQVHFLKFLFLHIQFINEKLLYPVHQQPRVDDDDEPPPFSDCKSPKSIASPSDCNSYIINFICITVGCRKIDQIIPLVLFEDEPPDSFFYHLINHQKITAFPCDDNIKKSIILLLLPRIVLQ